MTAVLRPASTLHAQAPVPASEYRADIDGLRAIAVLSVVLSHVPGRPLPGGYLGVDIFFVISGYLITRMIWRQMSAGSFSLRRFYWRRARRILPALLVMLAALAAAAFVLLPPAHRLGLGYSTLATLGFAQNVHIYLAPPDAIWRPGGRLLAHTWSLAIEEQFYLFFPLLCLVAFGHGRKAALCVLLPGMILSLGVYVAGMEHGRYLAVSTLLPTRAWELALGGLVALAARPQEGEGARDTWRRSALAGLGLALVVAALAVGGTIVARPWPAVLAVCLGAAMLIRAGERPGGPVGRLLSAPPLVFVGLISYSLYLWHWPLLAVPGIALGRALTPTEGLGCAAAAFVLSWLSWRFVERPVRQGVPRPALAIGLMAAATVLLLILSLALILSGPGGAAR